MCHLVALTTSLVAVSTSVWIIDYGHVHNYTYYVQPVGYREFHLEVGLKSLSEWTFAGWKPFSSECVALNCIINPTKCFFSKKIKKIVCSSFKSKDLILAEVLKHFA